MGFSGGGSNILKPHTHDGTVAQDGGVLNFDNVTQGSLTNGDLIYSDGVHLQRLGIGLANQKLESTGLIPQWVTSAAALTTNVITHNLTSYFGTTSTTWVSITTFTITLSNQTGGGCTIQGNVGIYGTAGREGYFGLMDDGVISTMAQQEVQIVSGNHLFCGATIAMATDGSVIDGAAQAQTGGNTEFNAGNPKGSNLVCLEVY